MKAAICVLALTLFASGCSLFDAGIPCGALSEMRNSFAILGTDYANYLAADSERSREDRELLLDNIARHSNLLNELSISCGEEGELIELPSTRVDPSVEPAEPAEVIEEAPDE